MEFRTQYDKRPRYICNPGSPICKILQGVYNKDKIIEVVPKGKKDLYAEIQSYADSVDINVLLTRFVNGDKDALLQRAAAYLDISALPNNINDFIELSRNASNLFDTLPVETKKLFNNNVTEFISTIGDKEWLDKMAMSPAEIREKIITESNEKRAKNKDAAKVQFGDTVFGEDYTPDPDVKTPKINPITGNEVSE